MMQLDKLRQHVTYFEAGLYIFKIGTGYYLTDGEKLEKNIIKINRCIDKPYLAIIYFMLNNKLFISKHKNPSTAIDKIKILSKYLPFK